jgi:multidrug transporter EmrE-like cation transporter
MMNNSTFFNWALVFASALFDSFAAFIVKSRFQKLGPINFSSATDLFNSIWSIFKDPIMVVAAFCFVSAPALWFFALNRLDLSVAYPVLVGLHLIMVIVVGAVFLNEPISLNKAIGTGLVLLSLVFFYSSNR